MSYTRANSTIRTEPERYITNPDGSVTRIYEAVVFGNSGAVVNPSDLQRIWRSRPRKTSDLLGVRAAEALMLANAYVESGLHPYIFRYESGRHRLDPNWIRLTEFEATSGGLFQLMGFNYKRYGVSLWSELSSIEKQLDAYDGFMTYCYSLANQVENGKDIIYRCIAAYGNTSLSGAKKISALANIKYNAYIKIYNQSYFEKKKYCHSQAVTTS